MSTAPPPAAKRLDARHDKEYIETRFFADPIVKEKLPMLENSVISGAKPVPAAVRELIEAYERSLGGEV